jgi:ATP-binding cassette subfamily B protein
MYASEALLPLVRLIAVWDEFQEARAALDRLQEVLDEAPEPQPPAAARVVVEPLRGHLRCEQVSFAYGGPGTPLVLREVSFAVRPGEHVAVVGRSGSGKTTLARLLLGLYRPTRGRIWIDGWDLRQLDLAAYRRQVGVVLQEDLLLCGTVRDNIALGDPQPDLERVIEAARQVGADEFIAALPNGYETVVGERGLTLSGGQRQRLSLARALYRQPRLLVLDEATSALDRRTEESVHQGLAAARAGRTTVTIAHSLTTARTADRILVLQGGVLVEQGRHDELLARRGAYFDLAAGPGGA